MSSSSSKQTEAGEEGWGGEEGRGSGRGRGGEVRRQPSRWRPCNNNIRVDNGNSERR